MSEFEERGANLVAVSVDPPAVSAAWAERRGFSFPILSDPEQRVIEDLYHLRNDSEPTLSLHAIYIVDDEGRVLYRKVARRRAGPQELLDALDFHAGVYGRDEG